MTQRFRALSCYSVLLLACSLLLASCGYTTRSTLSSNYRKIYIEPFKNKIEYAAEGKRNLYFPLIEVNVRKAVIDRFLFDGNLRVTEDPAQADLILKGSLTGYDRSTLRFTEGDEVEEYRLHITVSLELWDPLDLTTPQWTEPSFTGETTYFVTGALAKSEELAITDAIKDLARRVVERTVEDW